MVCAQKGSSLSHQAGYATPSPAAGPHSRCRPCPCGDPDRLRHARGIIWSWGELLELELLHCCTTTSARAEMPIHAKAALKRGEGSDDERRALLAGDEESEAGAEGYRGNGLLEDDGKRPGDVKSSTNYGAAAATSDTAPARNSAGTGDAGSAGSTPKAKWKRIARSAARVQHRADISDALKDFDVQAFEEHRVSDEDLKAISNKKLRAFYQQQVRLRTRGGRIGQHPARH